MVKIRCAKLLSVLEAKLKRLGRLYQDGFISDEQYEPDRDSQREQLSAATAPLPVTDMRAVSSGGLMETSSLPPFPQGSRSIMCDITTQICCLPSCLYLRPAPAACETCKPVDKVDLSFYNAIDCKDL
jgi:hypothetical protein